MSGGGSAPLPEAWILMAKEPRPGRVKTRLCPPLTPGEAADLYAAFLGDLADRLRRERPPVALYVAVHPGEAVGRVLDVFRDTGAEGFPQEGDGLPRRMEAAFARAFARGHRRVALSNTDSPHLSYRDHVRPALEALQDRGTDAAFGPDLSGGYYLVALKRPAPGLFDAPVSTGSNLDDTLATAVARGLGVDLLEPTPDVDVFGDLGALRALVAEGRVAPGDLPRTLPRIDALWGRYGR